MNNLKLFRKTAGLLLLAGFASTVGADDLQSTIQQLSGSAAKLCVAPIVTGFGANLNAGWYHKAPSNDKLSFTFQAGAIGMGTLLSGGSKTFAVADSFRFDSAQAKTLIGTSIDTSTAQGKAARNALMDTLISKSFLVNIAGPTVIGAKHDTAKVIFPGKTFTVQTQNGPYTDSVHADSIALKGVTGVLNLFSRYAFPLAIPQITVGTVMGTDLTLRWLPTYHFPQVGNVSLFGFGIQHNPSVWLPIPMPLDFGVGYFHQNLTVGNLFDASSNAVSLDVSKTLGGRLLNITPYGGVQWEQSKIKVHYDFTVEDPVTKESLPERIAFNVDGKDSYRATAGLSFHVFLLNLNADYSFAQYSSFSAGVMIGI